MRRAGAPSPAWLQRLCESSPGGFELISPPFLRDIDEAVPAELDIHCVCDHYATHSHPKNKAWLAARPRWHMHFIPTLFLAIQVERFFALITDKAIRRGSFTGVKQLVQRIDQFVVAYNTNCEPFRWTATADSILEKPDRLCLTSRHSRSPTVTARSGPAGLVRLQVEG
ncbi:MAG: hypothetical protein OZX49_00430 [Immundisolibacter sp.]|nr:hypothetical protein [Immundisolibacter sp.]